MYWQHPYMKEVTVFCKKGWKAKDKMRIKVLLYLRGQHCKVMTEQSLAQKSKARAGLSPLKELWHRLGLCWELSRPGARFVVDQSKAGNWTCWLSHCITSTFGILGLHFCVSFYTKLAPWLAWAACWAGAATSHPGGAEPSSPPLTLHRVDILHVGLAQVRAT